MKFVTKGKVVVIVEKGILGHCLVNESLVMLMDGNEVVVLNLRWGKVTK